MSPAVIATALAAFFVTVQFYTSLATLAPTPPVGYVFASVPVAVALVGVLALAGLTAAFALRVAARPGDGDTAASRATLTAWLAAVATSTLLGVDPLSGVQVVAIMALAAAAHLALVRFWARPPVARAVIRAYVLAGLAAAFVTLACWLLRRPLPLYVLNHGRAAGPFVTANQCAAFFILYVYVALGVWLADTDRTGRRLALAGAVAGTAALAATVSLAGFAGAAGGAVVLAAGLGARRAAAAIGLVGLLAAAALLLRPAALHNPGDALDRLQTVRAGLRVAELFPFTGVGPMAYWRVYPAVRAPNGAPPGSFGALHPHDVYVSLAGELGLVGLVAVGYGAWRVGRAVRDGLRRAPPARRRFTLGVCAGFSAVLVQGVFDTVGVVEMTFVWIPAAALLLAAAEHGLP